MIQAVSGAIAKQDRVLELTRATARRQWRTQYIGSHTREIGDAPQAFLAEMGPHGLVVPHFHEVNQFQVLIAGSGSLGNGMSRTEPDPKVTSGQYYLVVNGSLEFEGESYRLWSLVFVGPGDESLPVCAGSGGLEALVLNFPKVES